MAQEHCAIMGGYLAFPMNAEENSFINQMAKNQQVWLGGDLIGHNGIFFTSGSAPEGDRAIVQTFWRSGEPNNPVIEQCIQMLSGAVWNDRGCALLYSFVCQFPYAGACVGLPHPAFPDLKCFKKV
ncbi:collectin-11-like [Hyalella azteca]|uniref:Collectin-11-like n=1 Tax=Hyalella azteca TaxID=294128 RepID=A0A8B7P129_HYAAZ|nr:collectin-11-like [Hyalella azteca]